MTSDKAGVPIDESVLVTGAAGSEMIGVLAQPADGGLRKPVAVVIVVGGPQTRVGSHRQFVLMARALASAGYPCLRFDYTGMGDSPGPAPDFEQAGSDIRRACDALADALPACRRIALWGLCDGATAALLHAASDERIVAVLAANPWARSDATRSAAIVSEHYGSRLRSPEFWKKLLSGKVQVFASAREALGHAWQARRAGKGTAAAQDMSLPARLARVLEAPAMPVRLQISGRDLTAAEFGLAMNAAGVLERSPATTLRLEQADHTFSEPELWRVVVDDTISLLEGLVV
jgi:exosortase A-associated hydrolase 1